MWHDSNSGRILNHRAGGRPSYDICVEEENCIYKHIRETAIKAIFDAFGSENMEKLMILIIL